MMDEDVSEELYRFIESMTHERGQMFSAILEMNGIPDAKQPKFIKQAEVFGAAVLKITRLYAENNRLDATLFAALCAGMVSDCALRSLLSDEQDQAITDRSLQSITTSTRTVQ